MLVREKTKPDNKGRMISSKFNINALAEVLCYWIGEDGEGEGASSMYIKELDIFIEAKNKTGQIVGWKDMGQAFKDKDIITDNYNTYFFEPRTKEDRERGYTLN